MNKKKSEPLFDTINYIFMFILVIIIIYPLYFVIIGSFSDPTLVNAGKVLLWPKGITVMGYERIFRYTKLWVGYRNSIYYVLIGTTISVALTMSAGFAVSNKHMKYRGIVMIFIMIPMFFRGGLIPRYLVVKGLGMINTVWAMVLPAAVSIWNIMIVRTYFKSSIPDELFEAASIDGCGVLRFFSRIAIPLAKPVMAVMVLFYAVGIWNGYFDALIFLESEAKHPLQLVLRNILIINQAESGEIIDDIQDMIERQKTAALLRYGIIVVSSLPMLVLYPFIQKYFVKGIMMGSVKG